MTIGGRVKGDERVCHELLPLRVRASKMNLGKLSLSLPAQRSWFFLLFLLWCQVSQRKRLTEGRDRCTKGEMANGKVPWTVQRVKEQK